ncbi:MAG TPA: DUF2244 domain-containing protein [Xanthomonadaceae bacterium]|nr:DUF2244 domain-containing protein [Xanthomonadaceae bacterium]
MIEERVAAGDASRVEVQLSPNRSMSWAGLCRFFAMMAMVSLAVSGYSAWQGNVFAPFFAMLELAVLAVCLWLVWRAGDRRELISVAPQAVEVHWLPGQRQECFHPCWARMVVDRGHRGVERLWIGSHGKRVELGSFLPEGERAVLARRLRELLKRAARGAA